MKYKSNSLKLNPGILLPMYVLLWPFLYALVQIDAWSYYIDTNLLLIDCRLFFYILALGVCLFKFIPGNTLRKEQLIGLSLLGIFYFFYLVSFLFNLNVPGLDFHQFINGFLFFSVLVAYAILYSDLIDWDLVAELYALSLLISSIFGFYAFSRFSYIGLKVFSSSLSLELFRLIGNKGFWLSSVLILAFIFFEFQSRKRLSILMILSLITSNLLVFISGQRNAINVIIYELMAVWQYSSLNQSLILATLIVIAVINFSHQIFELVNVTFFNRIRIEQSLDGGRLEIWRSTLDALTSDIRHIIFGVGEGGLPGVSGNNWLLIGSDSPHNLLLYFWAATGLGGMIVFIGLIVLFGYLIHRNKKLHQILFYWLFVGSMIFVGFSFYEKYSKSDFLNIGIVIAFALLLRKQDLRVSSRRADFYQDSPHLNES